MNTEKILLDAIACISILCCAVYIAVFAKKAWEKRFQPLKGMFLFCPFAFAAFNVIDRRMLWLRSGTY